MLDLISLVGSKLSYYQGKGVPPALCVGVCVCWSVCGNRRPSTVTLAVMGVFKSSDLPTYEISSISSEISALGDTIRAEGWRWRQRGEERREEQTDDCRESKRRVRKRSSLHQRAHWLSGKTVATVAAGNH